MFTYCAIGLIVNQSYIKDFLNSALKARHSNFQMFDKVNDDLYKNVYCYISCLRFFIVCRILVDNYSSNYWLRSFRSTAFNRSISVRSVFTYCATNNRQPILYQRFPKLRLQGASFKFSNV